MSYWIKKQNPGIKPIQCLGKKSNGRQCKNKLYSLQNQRFPLCNVHNTQNVTFEYGKITNTFKDVAGVIAKYIDDPMTFFNYSAVCRSSAKACHALQKQKMVEFRISAINPHSINREKFWVLPSGAIITDQCEFTGNMHVNYEKMKEKYEKRVREINESKEYYRELRAEKKRNLG